MKKKILSLLIAAVMALSMVACTKGQEPTDPTRSEPTLPSFQEEKTPLEQLTEALEKTQNAESMTIELGITVRLDEEYTNIISTGKVKRNTSGSYTALFTVGSEDQEIWFEDGTIYQRSGSDITQYSIESLLEQKSVIGDLYAFASNENLLSDFCSQWLMVSPSNDGSFRYEVNNLTAEEFFALTGIPVMEIAQNETYAVALVIDADGYLSRLEYSTEAIVTYLSMTDIGNELELVAPEWATQP